MNPYLIMRIIVAAILIFIGVAHFISGPNFTKIMPEFMPAKLPLVYISGAVEIILGVGLFIPSIRLWAVYLIIAMLVVYLPIHIWDLMREQPIIGPKWLAILRIPMQFILIWMTWYARK